MLMFCAVPLAAFNASSSAFSWNMSSSCSALAWRINFMTSRFFWIAASSSGASPSLASPLCSSSSSPSESDDDSWIMGVSGVSSGPAPFSPRLTHFAMRASRRARLSASFRSTSSSFSSGMKPSKVLLSTSSSLLSPRASSSRQALRLSLSLRADACDAVLPSVASWPPLGTCWPPAAPSSFRGRLRERCDRFLARWSSTSRCCFFSFFSFLPFGRFSTGLLLVDRSVRRRFASPYPDIATTIVTLLTYLRGMSAGWGEWAGHPRPGAGTSRPT
mmetsp:Transcript_109818/g.309652  ORF Transcript_109818/g.309652 Transcript_109818/m.309652 type:complete len:274 (-) Transcript_109818:2-823(-)